MEAKVQRNVVRSVEGLDDSTNAKIHFRCLFPSSRHRLARRSSSVFANRCRPAASGNRGGVTFLIRADLGSVTALCSLIRHDILVPYPRTGAWSGQWNATQNRIARKGAGDRRDMAETPAHELSVNEAHARLQAKADQTPVEGGADRRRNCHKSTTSRESRIKGQAVRVRARAAGRKACPEMVAAFPLHSTPAIGRLARQEHGGSVPVWTPQAVFQSP